MILLGGAAWVIRVGFLLISNKVFNVESICNLDIIVRFFEKCEFNDVEVDSYVWSEILVFLLLLEYLKFNI